MESQSRKNAFQKRDQFRPKNSETLVLKHQSGLTLLNILISTLIVSVLMLTLIENTQPRIDNLVTRAVAWNHTMLSAGIRDTHLVWAMNGSPKDEEIITINDIPVQFKDGYLFDVLTNQHYPPNYSGPDNLSARVWYLLMNEVVTPERPPGLVDAGWEMLNSDQCSTSNHICWRYILAGKQVAKMEYKLGQKELTLSSDEPK